MVQHIAISGELTTVTEKLMVKAILKHFRVEDTLITGLRFHDHEYGDVEIVLNTEYAPHWQVAAFKVGRDEYGKLKQAYCNQYGSN